jgi:tellurite resistance protein TehA-like permease
LLNSCGGRLYDYRVVMPFQEPQHPAWYGSVMGTGALSLVLLSEAQTWDADWLDSASAVGLVLTSLLGVILLPRYLRRLRDRLTLMQEIAHPSAGPMLATLPAGILVLAAAWGNIGPFLVPTGVALWIALVLVILGVTMVIAFSVAWMLMIMGVHLRLNDIHGGWLIPPVMNMLIPIALWPIILANSDIAEILLVISFAFYGVGVLLFLGMFSVFIARIVLGSPFAGPLATGLWIPLAPAGLIGLAAIRMQQSADATHISWLGGHSAFGVILSAVGIGFGLWWSLFALIVFRGIRRTGAVPVQPGWWGLVFPIGALTLSIAVLGEWTSIFAIEVLGVVGTIVLATCWVVVAKVTFTPTKAQ